MNRPAASVSEERPVSGRPSVRFTWSPTPSPASRSSASRSRATSAVARSVVLVTMPWRAAARIPALTPRVSPKSSALTISRRMARRSARERPLHHEALDARGHAVARDRRLGVHRADVLEALVAEAREALRLARDDRRREPGRLEPGEGRLPPEEREDREDEPPARAQEIGRAHLSTPVTAPPPIS